MAVHWLLLQFYPVQFALTGGYSPILPLGPLLIVLGGLVPVRCTPLWPAAWLHVVDKSRGSKLAEVQRIWEIYEAWLHYMSQADAANLARVLREGDVSSAWDVWSSMRIGWLEVQSRTGGWHWVVVLRVFGLFDLVVLGFPTNIRGDVVDLLEREDDHMYRAPLLDLRRRPLVVVGVLGNMIRGGFTLARSLELSAQWNCILRTEPVHPFSADELLRVQGGGPGRFHEVAQELHCRLSESIHRVVVMRGDEAIRSWRGWLTEDPLVRPYRWLRPDLVLPRCVIPVLLLGALVPWQILLGSMRNSVKAWLPCLCRSGQREPSLEEFGSEVEGWFPVLPEFRLPLLTGADLAGVVRRKTAAVGSIDGWGWREMKALPEPWFDWQWWRRAASDRRVYWMRMLP